MDPDKILEYLRYLRSKIDALLGAPQVGLQEIAPLSSELRLFRERTSAQTYLTATLRDHLMSATIVIPPAHLAGSKEHFAATWWTHLPLLKNFFRASRQAKDRAVIDGELSKLRDHLHDLYCLVEVTFKNVS